ncbi:MAG: glycerophosphodiester phosphodiesterase family protein [Bacilli bacterium]|nr:glycerophosphodiester phosphodiesterase family protein [Bacilli bacterium]
MKRRIKIMGIVFIAIILLWVVFALIPPKLAITDNPFIIEPEQRPLIAAHRGGKNLNPENTFMAFDDAFFNYEIDILELDLCLTKDEHLVACHDLWINDCTDVEEVTGSSEDYLILEHSLEELREFNFGAKFVNKNGEKPYQGLVGVNQSDRREVLKENKLSIATIDEIFAAYKNTELMFIVEIKDSGEIGKKAADILNDLLTVQFADYALDERVVIGTFHTEIETYLKQEYPKLMRGGSVGEVTRFVFTQMFGVNIFDNSSFVCLQIPVAAEAFGLNFNLAKKTYINRAHRRNISVQYWTINEKEEMRRLIELGADVIMTDNPDVLLELLGEMGK